MNQYLKKLQELKLINRRSNYLIVKTKQTNSVFMEVQNYEVA